MKTITFIIGYLILLSAIPIMAAFVQYTETPLMISFGLVIALIVAAAGYALANLFNH